MSSHFRKVENVLLESSFEVTRKSNGDMKMTEECIFVPNTNNTCLKVKKMD